MRAADPSREWSDWTQEDGLWTRGELVAMEDSPCSPGSPTSVRLQPDEQRRTGLALESGGIVRVSNRSWTRQLVLAWNHPGRVVAELPRAAGDVSGYRTLVFRAAVNVDGRNPKPIANRAAPATQRLDLVLRDRSGRRAGVAAERFSSALDPSLGSRLRQLLLSDVRIPLRRFRGVDLRRLAAVELRFGVRGRRTGSIQLADMAFQ